MLRSYRNFSISGIGLFLLTLPTLSLAGNQEFTSKMTSRKASQFSKNSNAIVGSTILSAWTAWGPNSKFIVRAVSSVPSCPTLTVDSIVIPMSIRQNGNPTQFPVAVCEAEVANMAREIRMDDKLLPVPNLRPRKIVVLGDTGCEIKEKKGEVDSQACNDPSKWPFAKISKAAADWGPDLFIHVGDYHYREVNCPPNETKCRGAISGDVWESWRQDFFDPATALLNQAPGIFVRGNHELCARSGNGYFYLLDPRAVPSSCTNQTDPYLVRFNNGLNFSVIDAADDKNVAPSLEKVIEALQAGDRPWLVLHRPFLSFGEDPDLASLQANLPPALLAPGKINGTLVGHRHKLTINQFTHLRPPELIIGNGGTKIQSAVNDLPETFITQVTADQNSSIYPAHGFVTLELKDSEWQIEAKDVNGTTVGHCTVSQNTGTKTQLTCNAVDSNTKDTFYYSRMNRSKN